MEEELLKRNTDCVYFLASPLTCRKGIDCEYRHNEIARLNPVDCWYWLAGNCLNPSCGFRHPPLDLYTQVSSESTDFQAQSAASMNKANFPCYFYLNGFCYKGDKCSFLHGPDGSESAGKTFKASSNLAPVDKASTLKDKERTQTDTIPNSTETDPKPAVKMIFKPEDIQQLASANGSKLSISSQLHGSEFEEAVAVKSGSLLQAEGMIQSRYHLCTDVFQKNEAVDLVEAGEQWESSPGLDVLVEDSSENLDGEDDLENLPAHDRECMEHLLDYDLEEKNDYEILNSEAEVLCERDVYSAYEHLDNELLLHIVTPPNHLRERRLDSSLSHKRTLLPFELSTVGRHGTDLRDKLRRHKGLVGHQIKHFSRRHESSSLIGKNRKRPWGHGFGWQACARRTSEVQKFVDLHEDRGNLSQRRYKRHSLRHVESHHSKQYYSKKRLPKRRSLPPEVSSKWTSKEKNGVQGSTTFTGPKTLAQIKEEKKKGEVDCEKMRHSTTSTSTDFQGPKPLSELLKDKRRSESMGGGTSSTKRNEGSPLNC